MCVLLLLIIYLYTHRSLFLQLRFAMDQCTSAAVANLWHACPKWHARRFYVARHVLKIYQEIIDESYILKRLQ